MNRFYYVVFVLHWKILSLKSVLGRNLSPMLTRTASGRSSRCNRWPLEWTPWRNRRRNHWRIRRLGTSWCDGTWICSSPLGSWPRRCTWRASRRGSFRMASGNVLGKVSASSRWPPLPAFLGRAWRQSTLPCFLAIVLRGESAKLSASSTLYRILDRSLRIRRMDEVGMTGQIGWFQVRNLLRSEVLLQLCSVECMLMTCFAVLSKF